jgi:hypothetical protein
MHDIRPSDRIALKELSDALSEALVAAVIEAKNDIRKTAEDGSNGCQNKIEVGGMYFTEDELRENMNACFNALRNSYHRPAKQKVRSAKFCKAAAIKLQPKNQKSIVELCDIIIAAADHR